jgi:hypothetical protein
LIILQTGSLFSIHKVLESASLYKPSRLTVNVFLAAHQENGRVTALLEKRINESATVPNGRPPVQLSGSNLLAEPSPAEPLIPKWAHSSAKETGVASRPDQSNFSVADGPLISAGPTFQSPTKSLGSVEATQVQTLADRFSSPGSRFSTEPPLDKAELLGDELTGKHLSNSAFLLLWS